MKGPIGLIVALLLGVLATALNWVYLEGKTRQVRSVSFLGIREGVSIRPGDEIREADLVEVRIPEMHAGNLKSYVFAYDDRETLKGFRTTRAYQGGELVRHEDFRTPPPELRLEKGTMLAWVSVDSRSFVPELVNPGDRVTFLVPTTPPRAGLQPVPTDNGDGTNPPTAAAPVAANVELVGPFVIAAVGSRLGSAQVSQAARGRGMSDYELGILVKNEGTDAAPRLEAKAAKLADLSRRAGNQGIGILLHPTAESR